MIQDTQISVIALVRTNPSTFFSGWEIIHWSFIPFVNSFLLSILGTFVIVFLEINLPTGFPVLKVIHLGFYTFRKICFTFDFRNAFKLVSLSLLLMLQIFPLGGADSVLPLHLDFYVSTLRKSLTLHLGLQ